MTGTDRNEASRVTPRQNPPRRFAKSGSLLTRGTTTGRPLYMTNESDTEDKELQHKYSYQ